MKTVSGHKPVLCCPWRRLRKGLDGRCVLNTPSPLSQLAGLLVLLLHALLGRFLVGGTENK